MGIKKNVLAIALTLCLCMSGSTVFAEENVKASLDTAPLSQVSSTSSDAKEQKQIEGVNVVKYQDGRIEPIQNANNLTSSQLNSVLREMKFTAKEVNAFSDNLKREILAAGGVKVDYCQ